MSQSALKYSIVHATEMSDVYRVEDKGVAERRRKKCSKPKGVARKGGKQADVNPLVDTGATKRQKSAK